MKKIVLIVIIFLTISLMGCAAPDLEPSQAVVFGMDTVMTVTAYGKNSDQAVLLCETEVARLDALFSTTNDMSDVFILNRDGTHTVDDSTTELIEIANDISQKTNGDFDITIYPMVLAYGFTKGTYTVPNDQKVANLLESVGYQKITQDQNTVSLDDGVKIDLGAIAKGYLSDNLIEILKQHDVTSAMMSLGGNVAVLGEKPDGSLWRVGIEDPNNVEKYLAVAELSDSFVVTSGSYRRFFELNGKTYHHIIDPKTGRPADSGLLSVTVVSNNGALADALSTAFFVMGLDDALDAAKNFDGVEVVFVTDQQEIIATKGLEQKLFPVEDSGYSLEFIQ